GVQFHALLKDDLYERNGRHQNRMADLMKEALMNKGFEIYVPSKTNLIFADLSNDIIEKLEKEFLFSKMTPLDENHTRIRLVTSWATKEEEVNKFVEFINNL
ncbi:MAG: hypothetical protein IJA36_06190, partial [Lachnospiraceae bacterium]|nr:hypothetical protein [Lachnospiraceae bacterium]